MLLAIDTNWEAIMQVGDATNAHAAPQADDTLFALELASARIMIVDDEPLNVRMIRHQLGKLGYQNLLGISDPGVVIESIEEYQPDVVLMDVVMPGLSGTDLLALMRQHPQLRFTPVIILTASRDRVVRLQILELGVADFLSKPIDQAELSTRLRNVLAAKRYRDHLKQSAEELERAVRQRTKELEASQREIVLCLARAAEYRDDTTGRHVIRVGRYAAVVARRLGQPADFVEMIELAAQIAASHHERWDGFGYPRRLAGTQIPLEARIAAVADVFDALSTARCYKPAIPLADCFEIIASERGRHFDPAVVDAFMEAREVLERVFHQMTEHAGD
jgi:putative two-component system response regulator